MSQNTKSVKKTKVIAKCKLVSRKSRQKTEKKVILSLDDANGLGKD